MVGIIQIEFPVGGDVYDKRESSIANENIRAQKKSRAESPGESGSGARHFPAPAGSGQVIRQGQPGRAEAGVRRAKTAA